MGVEFSCISNPSANLEKSEKRLITLASPIQSSAIRSSPNKSSSIIKSTSSISSPTSIDSNPSIEALQYLPQFYQRIEHKLSQKVLNLQITLSPYALDKNDEFELPVETDDDTIYFGQ